MLHSNETPRIAIMMGTPNDWARKILKGILSYASEAGFWDVWIRPTAPVEIKQLPADWEGHGVIGRIISPSLAEELKQRKIPAVSVEDSYLEGYTFPYVRTDDSISTAMAADFFIERGFKNLAFAAPDYLANVSWYAEEYRRVLHTRGFQCPGFFSTRHERNLQEKLTHWLAELPKPVGILAYAEGIGRQIIEACRTAGVKVPHDVAVLSGSYDELMCYACNPPLSGILLPTEQIGYKAAKLLHRMMLGEDVPHKTTFLPPLGIREHLSTDTLAVDDPALVPLVNYLKAHAFEPLTMDDILKSIPMSRRTLERRFQKAFGRTPFDEIRQIRINHARKLLVETDKPLQIIAEECGYTTYNYLAQVFKQVTGCSPSTYRKRMRV
ncbi:AraC family transcriptional regulator [Pontiella agarivorans]|uniref:XylR family transcriptional regulator n=1 Tax=Pontiella agarivorans TaxID=3038953 RepID=A0ABU5N231_9BACT|nr:XylR family transcriptional regulator [Pontiella agarivorans]MDZ8120509.1 XylR family transcriptional regulator [Pontiella agarivorans]